jgi:preprotein translocase subunit SecA
LEFDDVLNHQRNVIYKKRRGYLAGTPESKEIDLKRDILEMVSEEIANLVAGNLHQIDELGNSKEDWDNLFKTANTIIPVDQNLINKLKEASKDAADKEFAVVDTLYKAAEDFWDSKEKEMGKEIFEGAQRFVALQALDNLWMEHLDTMNHLRDSVGLRGYGQRDPLVEYKKEGYILFQNLVKQMNKQIVYSVFHISVNPPTGGNQKPVQQIPLANLITNSSSGSNVVQATGLPQDPAMQNIGRNDPCPCGSGKKFKKCGLLNTPEHISNMAKK